MTATSSSRFRGSLFRCRVLEMCPDARAEYRGFRGVYIFVGEVELACGFTTEQAWGKALIHLRKKAGAAGGAA